MKQFITLAFGLIFLLTINAQSDDACDSCSTWTSNNPPDQTGTITGLALPGIAPATIHYYIKSNGTLGNPNFLDKHFILVEGLDFVGDDCNVPYKYGAIGWCSIWGDHTDNPEFGDSPVLLSEGVENQLDIASNDKSKLGLYYGII